MQSLKVIDDNTGLISPTFRVECVIYLYVDDSTSIISSTIRVECVVCLYVDDNINIIINTCRSFSSEGETTESGSYDD